MVTIMDKVQFAEGIISVYRIPTEWSENEYRFWWIPETDGRGNILRPARMSHEEKSRHLEIRGYNQIMNAGRTAVLNYIGASTGSTTGWSQWFAIGTGAITATNATDTSLSNEVFRKQPATFSVSGTQVDINIQLSNTDAQVMMTNAGMFGNGATSTLGSGSLFTHALFSYTKGNFAIAIDYIINLL